MKTAMAVLLIVLGFSTFGVINMLLIDSTNDKPVISSYQSCDDPVFESEVNKFSD
jgi:hypothetical protein